VAASSVAQARAIRVMCFIRVSFGGGVKSGRDP
jgi:hypothetical protein